MNLSKNRLAAFGAAGALAAGSVLAGGVISPAGAVDTTYTCTASGGTQLPIPVSVTNPFPSSVAEGAQVPAQDVVMNVSLSEGIVGIIKLLLAGAGLPSTTLSGQIEDAAMKVGSQSVPINNFEAPSTTIPATGGMSLPVTGTTSAFTPSSTGSLPVSLPQSFTFVPAGVDAFAMPCALTGAGSLGTLLVGSGSTDKESTTTRAKFLNTPLTTAKRPLIKVRVRQADGDPAAGRVIVKEGRNVLKRITLNEAGNKKFRIAKLSRGEHRIVFRYKGNVDSLASKVVKTVRVRRA